MRAAQIMHVPPWELMKQPTCFMDWALEMNAAMIEAETTTRPKNK